VARQDADVPVGGVDAGAEAFTESGILAGGPGAVGALDLLPPTLVEMHEGEGASVDGDLVAPGVADLQPVAAGPNRVWRVVGKRSGLWVDGVSAGA